MAFRPPSVAKAELAVAGHNIPGQFLKSNNNRRKAEEAYSQAGGSQGVAHAVAKALAVARYVAERCRDNPTWKVRTWELKMAVEDDSHQSATGRLEAPLDNLYAITISI